MWQMVVVAGHFKGHCAHLLIYHAPQKQLYFQRLQHSCRAFVNSIIHCSQRLRQPSVALTWHEARRMILGFRIGASRAVGSEQLSPEAEPSWSCFAERKQLHCRRLQMMKRYSHQEVVAIGLEQAGLG